jgi:uncharacterized protein YbjT (DUF2867 family)
MDSGDILIVGATGKQGFATICALHAGHAQLSGHVLALTRSTDSPRAKSLQERYPDIILVQGDSRDPEPIFSKHPSIASIFLVTVPGEEEAQAIPLIDAAIKHKVSHIVFASVDRGGDAASWENQTEVPHFASKYHIELHLRAAAENTETRWTILRPSGFMDNYNPGFFGQLMATMWSVSLSSDRKMQLISTHDIGVFAAKAITRPEEWAGRALSLAGDELTFAEADEVFRKVVGKELPRTWTLVGRGALWAVDEAKKSMDWFQAVGFGADIVSLRREYPGLQTFEIFLKDSSNWDVNRGS